MRIDSGLSGYSYQNRYVPSTTDMDPAAPETAAATTGRATGASTFSSTLLSSQLASALWTVEGSRKALTQDGGFAGINGNDAYTDTSRLQMVEAAYREYEIPSLPAYSEF